MSEKDNVVTYVNEELYFTKAYHDFGVEIESFGVAFQLSYSDFKRLVNRKRCQLTERAVEPRSVRLFVLDKTQPVCKTNVMAVDVAVQQPLDTFVVRGGLSLSEIRKLCKNLVK